MNWYSNTYNAFLIVGMIILFCTVGTNTTSSLSGTITGYSFIIVGILLLLGFLTKQGQRNMDLLTTFLSFGPILVFLGILIYIIYLLSLNFDKITSGNISDSYYNFMYIFIVLIALQIYLIYLGMQNEQFKLSKVMSMLLYLIEVVAIIVIITLGIILKYFATDG